jgi:hypothetical protein
MTLRFYCNKLGKAIIHQRGDRQFLEARASSPATATAENQPSRINVTPGTEFHIPQSTILNPHSSAFHIPVFFCIMALVVWMI